MISEAIVYGSVRDQQKPIQQITNLMLDGLSTKSSTLNTDSGKLYGDFTKSGDTYALMLYKDVTKDALVASATSDELGPQTLTEENDSGLSGTVNFAQWVGDDEAIETISFLSKDSDLPLNNLEGVRDHDDQVGFADFHLRAFQYLCREFLISRYKSVLWNPDYIDIRKVNNSTGDYDLSRCNNLYALKDASAHHAFYHLCERQFIEPGGIWETRYRDSLNRVKAFLNSVEMQFDLDQDRVTDRTKSLSVWKLGRA